MPANGSSAPVCPISRSQAAPGMPGVRVPAIPPATDLPSLVAAVNTIILTIQTILGPGGVANNVYPPNMPLSPSGGGSPTSDGGSSGAKFLGQPEWQEDHRDTEALYIFHKDFEDSQTAGLTTITNDKDQWVSVKRINTIEYINNNYGDAPFLWQYHTP